MDFNFDQDDNRITILPEERHSSVEFQLKYMALDGAGAYLGGCNFTNDHDLNDSGAVNRDVFNLFGWSLGDCDFQIELLSVTFLSSEKKQNTNVCFSRTRS